jgi:hypothetical protein
VRTMETTSGKFSTSFRPTVFVTGSVSDRVNSNWQLRMVASVAAMRKLLTHEQLSSDLE